MEFLSTSALAHPRFQPLLTSLGTDEQGEGCGEGLELSYWHISRSIEPESQVYFLWSPSVSREPSGQ